VAIGPNERRARNEATDREAKARSAADLDTMRKKTSRLKAERESKEAAERQAADSAPPKKAARAAPRKKPKSG